jgi:hypothetical protein
MTSSRSPGALGSYGFRNRRDHSYDALAFADSRAVRMPRVWDILSLRGRPVIILGAPQTYPVSRVNGVMVSCFLTPDTERSQYTYPSEVKPEMAPVPMTQTTPTRASTSSPRRTAPHGPGPERDLRDVAATILQLLGEPVPADMEGVSMLASAHI